jgi:hypothetical protein
MPRFFGAPTRKLLSLSHTNFLNDNVPNINFACTGSNEQWKNRYRKATGTATCTNVNDNLYKYDSILWL